MAGNPPIPKTFERIFRLEDQVKGLTETLNHLQKAYNLEKLDMPKPDQYVKSEYTWDDYIERLQVADPRLKMPKPPPTSRTPKSPLPSRLHISAPDVLSLEPYKYSPLNTETCEIRLLALQISTSLTDPITCRLIKVSLNGDAEDSSPLANYTPLSYCWGTTFSTERIAVDGQSFLVTPSLHSALLHFRKSNETSPGSRWQKARGNGNETYWWIDAICINQNDLDERKSQVALMTRLYKQARIVHVWLGEESEDSSRAMQLVREIAYHPQTSEERNTWTYVAKPGQTHRPDGPGRPMVKLPPQPDPISIEEQLANYRSIISLYQRPWFSRVWIRQEVALPEAVKFHCGTETCSWEEMMETAGHITRHADTFRLPALQQPGIRQDGEFASCFWKASRLDWIRQRMGGGDRYSDIKLLLLLSRDCQATDPRDKIYSMLPLTNPDETDITADYQRGHLELYTMATLSLIKDNLAYLSGCQNPSRSNGLPSWVPDLAVPWADDRCHYDSTLFQFSFKPTTSPQFTYYPEQSRLDVEGVIFDKVGIINHDSYVTVDATNDDVRQILVHWKEFYTFHSERLFNSWIQEDASSGYDRRDFCYDVFDTGTAIGYWDYTVGCKIPGSTKHVDPFESEQHYDSTFKRIRRLFPSEPAPFSTLLSEDNDFSEFRSLAINRRCVTTASGAIALVPAIAEADDRICTFDAAGPWNFVIRKAGDDTWVIVGWARKL